MSYGIFASYYDLLTGNVDYKKYAKRIDELVKKHGGKKGKLVDLACGTASLSFELEGLGYTVTGCDLSCDMLSYAAQKKYSQNSKITLVQQDMTALSLPGRADVFVCSLDALNHLECLIFVEMTFARVAKYMKKDSLFIFDMNTVYKHKYVLADNAFVFDTDEVFVTWQNEYNDMERSVLITLDFFVPDEEENFQRYSESFKEMAYSVDEIRRSLDNAGLRIIEMYDGLSNDLPHEKTERILFVCGLKR
ncbi:MAG: class I SAM-dependent methyltransferase [Oscillospiraceae bacterium]|nr:class I SAM-dependent methyltransferase [Oscillospiraceae bacterium]